MTRERYTHRHRSEVNIAIDVHKLFAYLDDHRRLAGHTEKPSLMMAGATMQVATDTLKGQAVGSVIRITGRVLGVNLAVDEVVTERSSPSHKTWETRGAPRLLVIGSYRMGFSIAPQQACSRLVVFIDYQHPKRGFSRVLGLIFGGTYAAWCTRRMTIDAVAAFAGPSAR